MKGGPLGGPLKEPLGVYTQVDCSDCWTPLGRWAPGGGSGGPPAFADRKAAYKQQNKDGKNKETAEALGI